VYREGHYELRPDEMQGGSQALDLQPAQGGFVEFTLEERGLYPLLTHKLANAAKGALGYFQAGEPRDDPGGHSGH
jgi:nitrite reductase (NO-forming)